MRSFVAMLSLVAVLTLVNYAIYGKETLLREGKIVYLRLAPIDPRSLMQGDYMALRFALSNRVRNALPTDSERNALYVDAPDGHVVVTLDSRRIASFKAIYSGQPLLKEEMLLRYRVRKGVVKFASNAFFFQEGQAERYRNARYGQFHVDEEGELLLSAMYDDNLKPL